MSNFLFVHGGMLGGWCWKKIRPYLEAKEHVVFSPTLTGLGEKRHLNHSMIDLNVHINDILNVIYYEDLEDVILVGHSYGGMVIAGVADLIPEKIKQLIYVDALVPENGKSMFDMVDSKIASYLFDQAQEKGDGWQVPPPSPENYGFKSFSDIEWITKKSASHPLKSFQQKIHLKNPLKSSISHFIKCTQDSALDSMLIRAKKLGFKCHSINSGHFPMVTESEKLSYLLLGCNI